MKIIAIILVFGVIVFVHELGHFLLAKLNKIKVLEFAIGMGPAIAKWGKKETKYSLRILPIGGYCMMEGEDEDSDDPRSFSNKSCLARLSVLFAGPFFNFILAFILGVVICHFCYIDPTDISGVVEGSGAAEAGLQQGDVIIKLDGKRIYNFRELQYHLIAEKAGTPVDVTFERDGERHTVTVVPKKDEESGKYIFGVYSNYRAAKNFGEELKYGLLEGRLQIKATLLSLKMLFTGGASMNDLMGPVGIGNYMSDVMDEAEKEGGFGSVLLNILNFCILISANLGVMNLLPIPALDGGRILFVLIEMVSGKKIPKEKEALVNAIGFILLMILVVFVFFNDIRKVFF
ncbi:MAG: RIP metalloprotease RseP [Eubacterium sp.]|nr:RIP metalloprotease RseP [Eubacterium sp.]